MPWRRVDRQWHRIGDLRVGSLGPLALPDHTPRVRHSGRFDVAPLTGRGETFALPLLAQVWEPHGTRVRARYDRLGTKRSRIRPLGRRHRDQILPLPVWEKNR